VATLAPSTIVEGCFLELVEPDLLGGVERAIRRGAQRLAVVPLLLVSAGHAKRDIPRLVAAAAAQFPDATIEQRPHLGSHAAIAELAQRRHEQALSGQRNLPSNETLLLVVGRGTKDEQANAALCTFARQRGQRTGAGWVETCFLAMTEPLLERALDLLTPLELRRIVVEPHLLFQGELLDRIRAMVAAAATRWTAREFIVAERLGPDPTLAAAILELAGLRLEPPTTQP
jgi:sirohydrochlorin cobaltochelatase